MRCCIRATSCWSAPPTSPATTPSASGTTWSSTSIEGGLYPVNAKRETIWGVPCYKDFASLPEKPDHVLVLVPARFAVQVIRDAAAAGARSATIVTSGFSELQDEESQRLAVELKQAVQGDRPRRHRPELPRQSERRRKPVHQYRRPHRHHGGRSGGDRRPIRRDRDGDPPGAGGSRRRRRLHGHDRQRDRPRDARSDELFRRRSRAFASSWSISRACGTQKCSARPARPRAPRANP